MAKKANPYGFKLIYAKESNVSGGLQKYSICSGYDKTIGSGDPVYFSNGSIARIADAAAISNANLSPIVGIFSGCSFLPAGSGAQFKRSPIWIRGVNTQRLQPATASVSDQPSYVFQVQTNTKFFKAAVAPDGTNSNLSITGVPGTNVLPIGSNFGFTYGIVDEATGQSKASLVVGDFVNPATEANENLPFKIIGLAPIENNNWTDDFVDVYVTFNNHYLNKGTNPIFAAQ